MYNNKNTKVPDERAKQFALNPAIGSLALTASLLTSTDLLAIPVPAGPNGMDPTKIPQGMTQLVIPPEMPTSPNASTYNQGVATDYNIAMRQFSQQILPTAGCATATGIAPLAGFKSPVCTNINTRTKMGRFKPTPVWSYGRADDPTPKVAPVPAATSSFNYPAFTVEARANTATNVRWINELVAQRADPADPNLFRPYPVGDAHRVYLPPITPVDQTLHWANPGQRPCMHPLPDGSNPPRVDCEPDPADPANADLGHPYAGPNPMSVHVHGADVNSQSDGYSEAWWLPAASNIPAGYADHGSLFDQFYTNNTAPGSAAFKYENDQPATTLWYHDHTLGMTRNNVYSGPAGFWLLRGGFKGLAEPAGLPGGGVFGRPTHPGMSYGNDPVTNAPISGCDPNFDAACREKIREIPIAIQDRSFNADGSLYFPASRDCFAPGPATDPNAPNCDPGLTPMSYKPADTVAGRHVKTDIAPIWNPEFFGNTMVVNGSAWPVMNVFPQRYRFRLLNGTDARTVNLSLYTFPAGLAASEISQMTNATLKKHVAAGDVGYRELPFYQIGAEQGFLPKVVKITTGVSVELPGNGTNVTGGCIPANAASVPPTAASNPNDPLCERGLLMMPAERADVIVDFTGLPAGTTVRVVNTGPDLPFGGFAPAGIGALAADDATTGRVMSFKVVKPTATTPADASLSPLKLDLTAAAEPHAAPATQPKTRRVALLEGPSEYLCTTLDAAGNFATVFNPAFGGLPYTDPNACTLAADGTQDPALWDAANNAPIGIPYAPRQAQIGSVDDNGVPSFQPWMNPVTAAPTTGDTEEWEIYNTTVDAHPVHVHMVRFEVLSREPMTTNFDAVGNIASVQPCTVQADPAVPCARRSMEPVEKGYKDTVIALPGEVTRVRATFEKSGLYVWHCHIVDHEDNEMMVPLYAKDPAIAGTPNPIAPTLNDLPVGNTGKTIPIVNNGAGL